MTKLAVVFRSAPHGTSVSREGLDALLAASVFSDDISVFFIEDGVFNLLAHQQPEKILQKDFIRAFKLLDLNDVTGRYVCRESVDERQIAVQECVLDCDILSRAQIIERLRRAEKILTF